MEIFTKNHGNIVIDQSGKCIEYIFLVSFSSKIFNWLEF